MRGSLVGLVFLFCLVSPCFASLVASVGSRPVVVVEFKGALGSEVQLDAIRNNITDVEWVVVTGEVTSDNLSRASMLIMVKGDPVVNYTDSELDVVKKWFDTGAKAVWVAASSDYGSDHLRLLSANGVLKKLGSVLMFEDGEVLDNVSSAGANYRLLATSQNCDDEMKFMVAGVTRGLYHGTSAVIAFSDNRYYKLEKEKPKNVYVVMTSGPNATLADYTPPPPQVHTVGQQGTLVVMAVELDPAKKNIIIATGEAPFDHYTGLYMPELYNYKRYAVDYPQQGDRLFKNVLNYVLYYGDFIRSTQSQISSLGDQVNTLTASVDGLKKQVADLQGTVGLWQGVSAATLIVGLAVGAVVVYFMRKR